MTRNLSGSSRLCRVMAFLLCLGSLFSCPLFYYFPVVCRAYCLIPLTLYFLIALYPVRLRKPFRYAFSILLLLYIHSYLVGMAGMLGLFFLIDLIRQRTEHQDAVHRFVFVDPADLPDEFLLRNIFVKEAAAHRDSGLFRE